MTAQLSELTERDVARRIVRAHNKELRDDLPADVRRQGFLIFDRRGRLLRWSRDLLPRALYPGAVAVGLAPTEIAFRLHAVKVTTADVILFLQARAGTTPHRDQAALYPSSSKPVEFEVPA